MGSGWGGDFCLVIDMAAWGVFGEEGFSYRYILMHFTLIVGRKRLEEVVEEKWSCNALVYNSYAL